MFAQLDAQMDNLIVEFLADKEAIRLTAPSGATTGEPFAIIFNKRPDQSFGIVQADELSCQCSASEFIESGTYLQIDAVAYSVDKVFSDGGLLTIMLGKVHL